MTQVFIDTSAFVALTDKKDRNHSAAKRCVKTLARARQPLVTSTYVMDELITLVRMRLGHALALVAGQALLESRWCELVDIDEALRADAWSIFSTYSDQTFSFTDCTSFALMKSLGAEEAFTFDRQDFAAAGFRVIPS
ncbi:MAG TPA: type II toxin-antitoxin system VapC family toxin [Polyangiaceae bacterium]